MVKAINPRRAASAVATLVAVVTLAWAVRLRGCGDPDSTPEGAVRAFVAAARAEDKVAVWELLGPETRRMITSAAAAATDKIGGAQRVAPLDLFDVMTSARSYTPGEIMLQESDGQSATVDVLGPEGRRDAVRVVLASGRWRVELWSRPRAR